MANNTIYPYGTEGSLPESIGLINDLITGGADKALTAQMGKVLGKKVGTEIERIIDLSLYGKTAMMINTSDKWAKNTAYETIFVRLIPGNKYRVEAGADNNVLAVLKDTLRTEGTTPNFATGFTGRIPVNAGNSYDFTAPTDGLYAYLVYAVSGTPRDVTFTAINDVPTALEEMNGDTPLAVGALYVGGVDYSDGADMAGITLNRTGYIDIGGVLKLRYTRCCTTSSSNNAGIAFYNENKSYIGGQRLLLSQSVNHTYEDTRINVPPRTKYVRFSLWADNVWGFYAYDEMGNRLDGRIGSLEALASPFAGKKLVATGDSIMYGSGIDDRNAVFAMLLARKLGMTAVNYAIGGTTLARKASDYDDVYLDYAAWQAAVAGGTLDTSKKYLVKDSINVPVRPYHIYSYTGGAWTAGGDTSSDVGRTPLVDRIGEIDSDADVIIINVGQNDWAYMWTDVGDDSSRSRSEFCGALHLVCKQLIANFPQKLILFMTPPTAWRYQPSGVSNATWNMTSWDAESPIGKSWWDYLDLMKTILVQYGIPLLDLGAQMGFSQEDTWWCLDINGSHVHPSAEAQPLIANAIARNLSRYAKE